MGTGRLVELTSPLNMGLNTHTCTYGRMGHKTITVSDEAYDALAKSRLTNESFTKVILRLTTGKGSARMLLQHVRSSAPDEGLALRVEDAMKRTRRARLRPAEA